MSVFNLNWSIYKIKLENKTKKQWQVSNNAELEYVKGIGNSLETIQPQNKGILQLAVNVFHAIVLLKGKQKTATEAAPKIINDTKLMPGV